MMLVQLQYKAKPMGRLRVALPGLTAAPMDLSTIYDTLHPLAWKIEDGNERDQEKTKHF